MQEARQKASELEKLSLVGRELLNKSVSAVVRGGGDDAEAPSPTKRGKVAPASAEDQAVRAVCVGDCVPVHLNRIVCLSSSCVCVF